MRVRHKFTKAELRKGARKSAAQRKKSGCLGVWCEIGQHSVYPANFNYSLAGQRRKSCKFCERVVDKLRSAAHAQALKQEITSDFPGVDIDAVHRRRARG